MPCCIKVLGPIDNKSDAMHSPQDVDSAEKSFCHCAVVFFDSMESVAQVEGKVEERNHLSSS